MVIKLRRMKWAGHVADMGERREMHTKPQRDTRKDKRASKNLQETSQP
jgi:hypothetical protein